MVPVWVTNGRYRVFFFTFSRPLKDYFKTMRWRFVPVLIWYHSCLALHFADSDLILERCKPTCGEPSQQFCAKSAKKMACVRRIAGAGHIHERFHFVRTHAMSPPSCLSTYRVVSIVSWTTLRHSCSSHICVSSPLAFGVAPVCLQQVSNKMGSGEWVYLCVQDMQTGHVITLQDNRAMLAAQAQASSSAEKDAFAAMLGKRS